MLRILTICSIETTTKVKQRQPLARIVHLTQSVSVYIEKQEHVYDQRGLLHPLHD